MRSLTECSLYGILDLGYVEPAALDEVAEELVEGGIDILQLRAKDTPSDEVGTLAARLLSITRDRQVPLVINDHPDIAREVGAEAVHVGQDDLSLEEVRSMVGEKCLVGKSTHSLDQAVAAQKEGADYIGFGPLFATPTKPDYSPIGVHDIARAHELVTLPVFCIGGIKQDNLASVLERGARRVVIVSGILQADNRPDYIHECRKIMAKTHS